MRRKKILEKRLARLQAKKAKLAERCNASTDVNEVRSLTDELNELNEEIEETQEEIDAVFRMTPYYFHTSAKDKEKLRDFHCLDTEISFVIGEYTK